MDEAESAPTFGGVVLVGGASTRMGSDKAMLEVDGTSLVSRAGKVLREAGAVSVVAVGRSEGDSPTIDRWVPDTHPGSGPLGGLITALGAADSAVTAVVACDLPAIRPQEITRLVLALGSADVAMTVVDEVDQPLHAIWSAKCLGTLSESFEAGTRSLRSGIKGLKVVRVEPLDSSHVIDVDTPDSFCSFLAGR